MNVVISAIILMGIPCLIALLIAMLDDPIGRELDGMRAQVELRALMTPLFSRAD
jgi:hypothetical protein